MDRLRWYIDGNIGRAKAEVGGTYRLDRDYKPIRVNLSCRVAGTGSKPTEVDIKVAGVSIFNTKAAMPAYLTEKVWTTLSQAVMRQDSLVTLDITGVSEVGNCRDLTVELEVE